MTEKRFTITQDFEEHHRQIRDNGKIIMGCFLEPQAEPIVKLLNDLHEEIEYLKPLANENTHYIADMEDDIISFKQKIEKLEKENKQLNQDRTRLLNFLRRELEYDVGDEIYDILHNKFYDKVWWDEENEKITSEYIKKDHEEWIKPR